MGMTLDFSILGRFVDALALGLWTTIKLTLLCIVLGTTLGFVIGLLRSGTSLDDIAYVMFRDYQPDGSVITCTTLKPGRVDRSPCGTGSSANLAILHARGQVRAGDIRTSRSIIGGTFTAEMLGETTVGGRPAVLPRITGQGYVFGRQQLRLDANDPFAQGFAMSDTWGPQVGEL